jgi:hypothetical protein
VVQTSETDIEVADVRRSRPDEKEDFIMNGGRVDARAVTLKVGQLGRRIST